MIMNVIFLRKYWEINTVFTKKIHTAKQTSPSAQWVDSDKGTERSSEGVSGGSVVENLPAAQEMWVQSLA